MNKIKTKKYKSSPDNGIFSKISKRYSTVVNSKLLRRSTSPRFNETINRRSKSPQKHIISGSYNMSGHLSEDHKNENGAPILISKINLDADCLDSNFEPARINTIINNTHSSESETEMFTDAVSSFPIVPDIKFEFRPRNKENSPDSQETGTSQSVTPPNATEIQLNSNGNDSSGSYITGAEDSGGDGSGENYYESPKNRTLDDIEVIRQKTRSKSAQNLHKSELRVFLQRVPSNLEMDLKYTTADLGNCYDLPIKNYDTKESAVVNILPLPIKLHSPNKFVDIENSQATMTSFESPVENILPLPIKLHSPKKMVDIESSQATMTTFESPAVLKTNQNTFSLSAPNTPMNPERNDFLNFNHHFKSAESLIEDTGELRKNIVFSSSATVNRSSSRDSVVYNSSIEDFDLKSVSFQSLDHKNFFLSIEELNEITREINESEDFNNEIIDLEYCEHRDTLKPNERRITLLKNKNSKLISLDRNKEKLNHAWTGLKHWIGEESGKFKEVVQKHAALQRVGGGKAQEGNNRKSSRKSSTFYIAESGNSDPRASVERSEGEMGISSNCASSILSVDRSVSANTMVGSYRTGDESDANTIANEYGTNCTGQISEISSHITKKSKTSEGQNGFEELRRYMKQGEDFGKDIVGILQERIDSEQIYAKSLTKMATKLNKACRDVPGSIADAWRGITTEMETRSELHRQLSASLHEELVKPLKSLLDNHHKTRKSVETNVDKASRILSEWRISEGKAKKLSHAAARENEKLQDAMLDVRIQKSPSIALLHQQIGSNKNIADKEIKSAEKDCVKLDNKRRKAEESVKRADVEYYTLCIRSERARVDWEMSVIRGSQILQTLENQRLTNMKQYVNNYVRLTSDVNPILEGLYQRLIPQIEACNVQKDMIVVKNVRRTAEGLSEQLLPDFYCEHTTLAMNRERRKHALIKLLQLVKTDLERERRSRNGLKGLSQTMNNQDNQNITDKLYHIRSMLTYLEGARFKLQAALLELDHKPRTSHPLAPHIQITRDRTGLQQSILKVPLWLKNTDKIPDPGEDGGNDYDCDTQINNGGCIDIKNEILIKHFDKNFNRSKSTTEIKMNGQQQIITNGKSNTLPINDPDSPTFDRGIADGGSNQPDSDFDEFSSEDEDSVRRKSIDKLDGIVIPVGNYTSVGGVVAVANNNSNKSKNNDGGGSCGESNGGGVSSSNCSNNGDSGQSSNNTSIVISKCKALYSYTPKLYDELELTPGDIIEVHAKQEDGWWLGALDDQIGIFPATYVEEFV